MTKFKPNSKPNSWPGSRRAFFFSIDALFALFALISLIYMFTLLSFDTVSPELTVVTMYSQAGDAIDVLAKTTATDVKDQGTIQYVFSAPGLFTERNQNDTMLDLIGALWASNVSENFTLASNVSQLVAPFLPENTNWAFLVQQDVLYNSSPTQGRFVTGISKRLASGYMLSEPVIGYVSRSYITTIKGKRAAAYSFFGGFVGQGNLTSYVRGIPFNSTIQEIYAEFNLGGDADMYINNVYCTTVFKSPGDLAVDNLTITDPFCLNLLQSGIDNKFYLNFSGENMSADFVGGGFIKVTYTTDQLDEPQPSVMRYYFPGIRGIINLYDSFYVPGNINTMHAHLEFVSNYTTFLNIGNKNVLTSLAGKNNTRQVYDVNDTTLSALLSYSSINLTTVPLRLGTAANGTAIGNLSNADVILITDISGSMDWQIGSTSEVSGQPRACNDPDLYDSDTQRLALAKCLDKSFISTVLNDSTPGSRIGLVAFSTSASTYETLTSDANYLKSRIDLYDANGGTCICCAINRAYNLLAASPPDRPKYIIVMTDGIAGYRCADQGGWTIADSPTTSTLYALDLPSPNYGYAVGNSGRIIRWNGASWSTITSPTSSTLYGISMSSNNFGFAVGYTGRIIRWNVSTGWATVTSPTTNTLRGVSLANASFGFAVGASGRIIRWNGASWSTVTSPTTNDLYAVEFVNSTRAYAVGQNGRIIQWNGSTNTWSTVSSPTGNTLYSLSFVSSTEGYAVGANGRIITWDGASWSIVSSPTTNTLNTMDFATSTLGYAMDAEDLIKLDSGVASGESNPSTNAIYGVNLVNGSLGFAVGSSGRILRWDSVLLCNGTSTTGTYGCGGNSGDCNNAACDCASQNAVYSAGRAHQNLNITVHSIGFGPVASCDLSNTTLQSIALAGNGLYQTSSNASELLRIYLFIAGMIINQSFVGQIALVTGNVTTELYPESYLEISYTPQAIPLGYREIIIPLESTRFSTCEGSFYVPVPFNISEIKVASYSASYWTDNVSVRSSATGGNYRQMFKLSDYSVYYQPLGDPYIVQFPPQYVQSNETNSIYVGTGYTPSNSSTTCPASNRAIYKARFSASVPYGAVLPFNVGHNVSVFYDLDYDGISDGVSYVSYGENTPGYSAVPVTVDQLDFNSNALDNAFMRLLEALNFMTVPGNSGLPGSSTNPVDIQLSSTIGIQTNSLSEVPYMWGPVEMGVMIWK